MSAPIGSSTTRSASVAAQTRPASGQSGVASAALGQAGGSRPQVQSRRMSLKLGPLGITYSTDQVLWPEAAATAGAGAAATDADRAPGLDPDAEPVDPVSGLPGSGQNADQANQADQTGQTRQTGQQIGQTGAAAAGPSFHLELAQAWRRQLEERAAAAETYGPDGASRFGLSATATTTAASSAAGTASSAAAATASTPGAASSTAASFPTASAGNTTAPPAARMRRAIGAYLACARDFSSAQPMLTAVA